MPTTIDQREARRDGLLNPLGLDRAANRPRTRAPSTLMISASMGTGGGSTNVIHVVQISGDELVTHLNE